MITNPLHARGGAPLRSASSADRPAYSHPAPPHATRSRHSSRADNPGMRIPLRTHPIGNVPREAVAAEDGKMSKTYNVKQAEIDRQWRIVDATDLCLGRLASTVAHHLRGKHKPIYTPHLDTGDFVIVVNAEKVVLTGRKEQQKVYYRHSGYPGGLKEETAGELRSRKPQKLIENAVWGMLPKKALGRRLITKLKVYAGPDHPHAAQKPEPLEIADARRA